MQLNKHGKLARYYLWFDNEDGLPNDLCTFFWGLAARVVIPLLLGGAFLLALLHLAATLAIWVWSHKTFLLAVGGSLAAMALLLFIANRWRQVKIEIVSETRALISEKIKAIKGRYCPRIEWTTRRDP